MTATATTPTVPPPAPPEPRHGLSAGRLTVGGLLILLGLAWLGDVTGAFSFRWQTVLSAAVLGVGIVLLLTARSRSGEGLIGLGIILSILLLVASFVPNASLRSGAGELTARPATVAELEDGYQLGAGKLTIDLRQLTVPPGETRIEANVGAGELNVHLPAQIPADVTGSAGLGEVNIAGRTANGVTPSLTESLPGREGGRLVLDLSVGMGQIEVTR